MSSRTVFESGIGYHLAGRASLAVAQARGNSASDRLHGDGELVARAKAYRWALAAEANRGRDGGELTASNWRGSAAYDRFFAAKEFVYGKGSLEKDRFKDIRLRRILGAGYGYQVFETDMTTLALRGGVDHVSVDRLAAEDESYPALGWGVDYRRRLTLLPAEFFHVQEGSRGLNRSGNVVLHTRTGLRVPLAAHLNATAQLNAGWESQPAPGRDATDTTLLLGIGYEFK